METDNTLNKKGLKLKFTALYILSLALVAFIISVFIPRTAASNTVATAKPLESNDVPATDLLNKLVGINAQYQSLKQQDQNYSGKAISPAGTGELTTLQKEINENEKSLSNKLDSLDNIARSYTNQKSSSLLHSFVESFRMVLSDRSSMQAYKTTVLSGGNLTSSQQDLIRMQNEIQVRNSRITALEGQISSLQNKQSTVVPVTENTNDNQQKNDALQATINAQESKIANLTATNASLEKELRANNDALDQLKKSSDNSSQTGKNQTAILEKRISDLNAEIRFVQVDCNLARVDATQIISNAKQRKLLLADALSTLNTLSATGDASVKRKVAEKMSRLNQVASSVRD